MQLSEEHEALRATVEEFAQKEVAPVIGDFYIKEKFPYALVKKMGEMGLFGLPVGEEYGGMGGDYVALCVALEELGRVDQSVAITLEAGVSLGIMPLLRFGSDEQKQRWLPDLAAGRTLGGFGLTEAGGGSDAGATRTTAKLDGGEWVINGTKAFITNSGTDITSLVTVTAVTDRGEDGKKEISAILVPAGTPASPSPRATRRSAGTPPTPTSSPSTTAACPRRTWSARGAGATRSSCRSSTRAAWRSPRCPPAPPRAASTSRCATPASARPSAPRSAPTRASSSRSPRWSRAPSAPASPGRTPPRRCPPGVPFKKEAAIAKLVSSNAAMDNARDATQIFGGYGFMNEYPVARHYRDSKILEIGEGTSEVQKILIARHLGL